MQTPAQEFEMTTKTARKGNPHIGSDPDELAEEGIYDEAQAIAVKRADRQLRGYLPRASCVADGS